MSVGILIITHDDIGQMLMETAVGALGFCPTQCKLLKVSRTSDPDELVKRAQYDCDQLDSGEGVLVLTDMYGSTPSNISCRLQNNADTVVVSGVNLPMLIRAFNYPMLPLLELAEKAVSGGREGIMNCSAGAPQYGLSVE